MPQLETLREMCEIMKSMAQPVRHHPVVIASPPLLFMRNDDGTYTRNERGHLVMDQLATYKQNRPVAKDYSLESVLKEDQTFTDYMKCLTDMPFEPTPRRQIKMMWRRSPWESAKWQGFQWGGRTNASATEHALRRAIQKTIPKAPVYTPQMKRDWSWRGKSRVISNLCYELFGTGIYSGRCGAQVIQQDIINDRFRIDPVRLSTQLTSAYAQLPLDGRFTLPYETLESFYVTKQSGVYTSTGHWD
jgi:hypothetical protein